MRTMPPSEKRAEANRRNAQWSTGARTEEGKRKIRGNAVKHGLAGKGVALPKEMAEAVAKKVEAFVEALKPTDDAQLELANSAAMAATRLEFCRRQEVAKLAERQRHAVADWDARREAEVLAAAKLFPDDPASAILQLRRTAAGCDWLLQRWEALALVMEWRGFPYLEEQVEELCRLLGARPDDDNGPFHRLREDAFTCLSADEREHLEPETLRLRVERTRTYAIYGHADGRALDPDEAPPRLLATFAALVKKHTDDLRARRETLWREVDGPDRAEAPERCLVDVSPDGMNLRRYEAGFSLSLHRDLREIARRQAVEAAAPPPPPEDPMAKYLDPESPWPDIDDPAPDEATSEEAEARNEPTSAPLPPPRLSPWRLLETVLLGEPTPEPAPDGGGWPA